MDSDHKLEVTPITIPGTEGEIFSPTDDKPLHLTEAAVAAIKDALAENPGEKAGLRVSVVGGGCAGYQYNLGSEDRSRTGDFHFLVDGMAVYLDPISDTYLRGTVIDFVSDQEGHGFKFLNPNPRRRCGCSSAME